MKNPLFIIIAAIIGLIVILAWIYLMFFNNGVPAENIFTGFGSGEEDTSLIPNNPPPIIINNQVNLDREQLRQLTTRPVAGFREIRVNASSSPELYYVESGTGHIYSINTITGEERRLSGTTIAQAKEATISKDGSFVAISSINNTKNKRLTIGKLDYENNFLEELLIQDVSDFHIGDSDEVLFTTPEDKGLVGYAYNIESGTKTEIFVLPFYEAKIQWGSDSSSVHYVYPKSSFALEGFLYEINEGKLNRLPLSGTGFSALVNDTTILYTKLEDNTPTSFFYSREAGLTEEVGINVLPEKCLTVKELKDFFCPRDNSINLPLQTPDEWYKGNLNFKDAVWLLDPKNIPGGIMFDTINTGREVDIIKLASDMEFTALFFTNKNDNTLWMYELYE